MGPRFKVCCIASPAEAALALRHGASAVGLVSAMPSGPGPIPEADIAAIARTVPPGVATFLLTCLTDADALLAQQRRCGCDTLQLVDAVAPAVLRRLRAELPGIRLVQVIHVLDESSVAASLAVAPLVDALLLDSGNPRLAVKELGGTGRVHDWSLSRRIVEACGRPVFLAGGLRPDNAAAAVAAVRPHALDVCSGLRTAGALDEAKLAAFVRALDGAFQTA
ncbi:MAG: phosphoribosylanthranilate isomerase [Limisphaerales bacterium]